MEKERELRTEFSQDEVAQKVELYNAVTKDHLKMTLVSRAEPSRAGEFVPVGSGGFSPPQITRSSTQPLPLPVFIQLISCFMQLRELTQRN